MEGPLPPGDVGDRAVSEGLDLNPVLIASTCGVRVKGKKLPNGQRLIPLSNAGCCPTCLIPDLAEGDCNECRNTGIAGPYPETMADHVSGLPAELVDLPTVEPSKGWVIPCHLCHPEAYPGGFPGLRSPIGTWLIPPNDAHDQSLKPNG